MISEIKYTGKPLQELIPEEIVTISEEDLAILDS